MDLTGASLPTTKRGNKYILVVKDSLTRYVEIYPLKNKEPVSVAQLLVDHIYCRHGSISTLVSDQGTEFLNKVITQVCALLRINKVTTAPHAPRSDGLVENHNRTLKDQLAGYTSAFQD
jgi:IS30 family transposase